MTQCVQCHATLPDHSRFCFACGADQTGDGADARSSGPIEALHARLQRLVQGEYEIERLLGKGGMGAVFLAKDLMLEREVAIKVLPPDFSTDPQVIKRFQQEAKTAARLDHPDIIPIYRVESAEGLNYFVMKYISGTSLENVLESKQPLSFDYVQRILWEAACALGHAHSRGIVHRDVKPANIMFDHDGRVMLTDFGISKALQSASGLTGTGMIIGTPHYMAPEQAKGQPVDGRADQYSLGVVAYRLLSGTLPFSGDSVHTILYKHIFEEAPRVSSLRRDIPRYLTDPIQRALAKDPAQRFPTMEDFATAIWPEQPVSAAGKATPTPRPLRGPGTSDLPTEHVAAAAAPTTPLPSLRSRPAPAGKRSSRAGRFVFLGLIALGAGGYYVWNARGSAGGAGAPSAAQPESSPPPVTAQSLAVATAAAETTVAPAPDRSATSPRRQPQRQPPPRATPPAVAPQVTPPPVTETEGYLTIDADPFGTVFVDGVNVGQTPIVQYGVKPGTHVIRVERPGYQTVTEQVQVVAGGAVRKRYTLTPQG